MRLPLAAFVALATLALAGSAAASMQEVSTTRKAVPTATATPIPASITPTGGYYITPILPAGFTAASCAKANGTVVSKGADKVCQTKAPVR